MTKTLKQNEVIDISNVLGDTNEIIAKKFNALVNFINQRKEVILERGCLNGEVSSITLYKRDSRSSFWGEYFIGITDKTFNREIYFEGVEDIRSLKIDRKYKCIVA